MENLCQSLAPLSPCPFSPSCHPGSLSPISFPPSPSLSRSAHGESSLSPPSQRYSEAARDQDDLTCLSWLHQRGDLLPLRPLPKAPPPPGGGTEVDPGSAKPPYSFSSLIFMAIEDSSDKRLPVKDIYGWIVDKFPYYRTAGAGWRNSVRHNLSLSKSFCRMERDKSQSVGKGSLWCVSPEHRASLLEVLRKTHAYHSANSSLINKPALLSPSHVDALAARPDGGFPADAGAGRSGGPAGPRPARRRRLHRAALLPVARVPVPGSAGRHRAGPGDGGDPATGRRSAGGCRIAAGPGRKRSLNNWPPAWLRDVQSVH
ncbi:forkhead box protein N3 isoform X2 [Corythoichthys intestinalis]|uniref:forkhead box protein N3 isoform X2 n=1 Tax=Corythoichthys intestinalis TaxID=161448 RepID=UPI0025A645EC|nr:forkhead box protein N3 isoform X2 [Corythoichthys intestinalis]